MQSTTTLMPQMSLGLSINEGYRFDNFFAANDADLLVSQLTTVAKGQATDFIYISGGKQSGKTHLLLATYHLAQRSQINVGFLPLEEFIQYSPEEALIIYADTQLLLIDDIDLLRDDYEWQCALFALYNQRKLANLSTVFTGKSTVNHLDGIQLNDLKTRLSACVQFHLNALNEQELVHYLQFCASLRGMALNEQCQQFILLRAGRSQQDLLAVVERLDEAQLAAGKRITVPFIKALFNW